MNQSRMGAIPAASDPRITLAPSTPLADEPIYLRVEGLQVEQEITITAELHDDAGTPWRSWARFRADSRGIVNPATHPPLSGSYSGVDSMGLFWSMVLDSAESNATPFRKTTLAPLTVSIHVDDAEERIATASFQRLFHAPQVKRSEIRTDGLVGTFFAPAQGGPYPAVLIFGGSGGGLSEVSAAVLATHGYATLAFAYFNYETLPPSLHNIPLEYFEGALTWLQAQPEVRAERLAVMGASRGGELALLLGATFPQIKVVVAYTPSNVVWEGFGKGLPAGSPAWRYGGESLPIMQEDLPPEEVEAVVQRKPIAVTPLYLISLADEAAVEAAAIPVERSQAALLLISGQDDQMWPSSVMANMVVARLEKHGYPYPYQHCSYPNAGHLIGGAYLPASATSGRHPLTGELYAYGGTARGNAAASVDARRQVLAILGQHLQQ